MRTDKDKNNHDELLRLVDRYFEGETSLEEERLLRRLLAESESRSAEVEEARAVMGLFACARSGAPCRRKERRSLWFPISVAASIAVIIGTVITLSNMSIGKMPTQEALAMASQADSHGDRHDSIAQLMPGEKRTAGHIGNSDAAAAGSIRCPDTPDEAAALISSEMGYMAEAQRTTYESMADDLVSIASIIN